MRRMPVLKILAVIAVSTIIFSCNKSRDVMVPAVAGSVQPTGEVAAQLKLSNENLRTEKIDASIISYEPGSELKDDSQVEALKKKLVADDNFVPEFDGSHAASFKLSTIKERMLQYGKDPDNQQNVEQNIQQLVFPLLQKGQKVLTILWKVNGKQFSSTCVYNDKGIVYDNMLSNITLTETTPAEA